MRICASTACHNSSRHLHKWRKEVCAEHGKLHGCCGCPAPFRFHYFPRNAAVREEWVRRVGRQEPDGHKRWEPRRDSVLCSKHFVNGGPSVEYPVPWFKLGRDFGTPKPARRVLYRTPPGPLQIKKELSTVDNDTVGCNVTIGSIGADTDDSELSEAYSECDTADVELDNVHKVEPTSNDPLFDHNYQFVCEHCHDCSCTGCLAKQNHTKQLLDHIGQLEDRLAQKPTVVVHTITKVRTVQPKQRAPKLTSMCSRLLVADKKVRFYTGLKTKAVFDLLFEYLEPKMAKTPCWRGPKAALNKVQRRVFFSSPAKFGPSRKLQLKDEFLMVLMKLRMGLLNEDLAGRFSISAPHVSRVFTTWVKVMAVEMQKAVSMPPQENIRANLPKAFKKHYKQLRGILDCTEVFIQRPRDLKLQAMTHSDYKSHNTAKILVCITPRGKIGFVSKAWGGRASDKHIVNHSGFLDLVLPQDQYMVDKGFPIRQELMLRGADLVIPPAAKGQVQSTMADVALTKKVANLRIHVERAIGRLKWFRILQNTLPNSLVPLIDDIVITCAGLCNFYDHLV